MLPAADRKPAKWFCSADYYYGEHVLAKNKTTDSVARFGPNSARLLQEHGCCMTTKALWGHMAYQIEVKLREGDVGA